jgi:formylglycine-generating enzyme required for sulfatase activity
LALAGATISGARTLPVFKTLGIQVNDIETGSSYPSASIRAAIERNPRHVTLGNAPQQMQAAFAMCQKYSATACRVSDFSDEILRDATLDPFDIDPLPVSVQAFRRFVDATHYRTEAETLGYAYAGSTAPQKIPGGNWRNAIMQRAVNDDSAVVGVTFQDAVAYCHYKNQRLPTENEWEYVARGPERHTFPWGEAVAPATAIVKTQPRVGDGPAQGIGGRYHGLSGNVWQWVDSRFEKYRILKGGSWLDPNPANKRAAARLYQPPNQADDDSGFRCARSLSAWPDTDMWMSQLK